MVTIGAETVGLLRDYRRAGLVIVFLGALATGLVMSSRSIESGGEDGRPGIMFDVPSTGAALMWSPQASDPATTQARSLSDILAAVSGLAWLGFAVAGFSILSCYAAQTRMRAVEASVRRAVGASLRRIRHAMLLEAAVLGAGGLILGRAIASALVFAARHSWPGTMRAIHVDPMATALALAVVLAAGSLACFAAARTQPLTYAESEPVRLRVPVLQVGASVALLLLSAALLSRPDTNLTARADATDDGAIVLTIDSGIADPTVLATRYGLLLQELSRRGDSDNVSLSSPGALLGLGTINEIIADCGQCFLGGLPWRWQPASVVVHAVSPTSFDAVNARLVSGRMIRASDDRESPRVAVVNRSFAFTNFQHGQPIGRDIFPGPGFLSGGYRVVGVVDDDRSSAIGGSLQPRETVYVSVLQRPPRNVELLLRGSAGSTASRSMTTATITRVLGSHSTIRNVESEDHMRRAQGLAVAWCGAACGVIAILVLALALVGTASTTAMWASSMAWELTLRRAVGARRWRILAFVLARTAGIGLGGAALGAYAYASALGPVLSLSIAHLALPAPGTLLWIVLPPVLLTVLVGTIPGARFAWGPPSAVLR